MQKMTRLKNILLVSLLIITVARLVTIISGSPTEIHADTDDATNITNNWEVVHQKITTEDTPYAIKPSIATSPDGKTVFVVYSSAETASSPQNQYYSFSRKNGETGSWTMQQQLNDTSATSSKAHVTFDQNNRAHVVWTEGSSIAYAKSISSNLNDGFGTETIFPNIPGNIPEAADPKVITYGNDVHIIWAEGTGNLSDPSPDIYHRQSTDGGANWGTTFDTPNPVTTSAFRHKKPAVTIDDAGNLHVLYEKQVFFGIDIREQIRYAKGTLSNGAIIWADDDSTHPDITANMSIDIPNFDVVEPDILYANGHLETSVTQRYVNPVQPSKKPQFVFHIGCASSCENELNWSPTRVSDLISYLDASPYSLTSSIMRIGNCLNITFDGKVSTESEDSEQIFLSNGCNGWGGIPSALTNNDESRTIQPAAASQNDWWGYIVYEEFVGDDDNNANKQVFFTRNSPALYLPIIVKN